MTQREQELSEQLFGDRQQSMVPGLSWDKFKNDLANECAHQVAAGAHELAAALFNGNGFVMYQRDGKENEPVQDQTQDNQGVQQEMHGEQHERGGRSI